MTPSSPHKSTMGTGDHSRVSVTVFRLCGHAASGPRLVFDQSNCLISPPSSPPPVGNDPPDSADTPLFGNGPPPLLKWIGINDEKSFIAVFVPSCATLPHEVNWGKKRQPGRGQPAVDHGHVVRPGSTGG